MRLREFNRVLKVSGEDGLDDFVQKYLLHGTPVVFEGKDGDYFEFRNRIAQRFKIGFHEVFIVGSAKQGFSYYKKRDSFDYDSDVDVAIVSEVLFEEYSKIIRDYEYARRAGQVRLTPYEFSRYQIFLKYYALGWIRPDMSPSIVDRFPAADTWEDFFKSISFGRSEVGDYKVSAGIFKSYDYLKKYHRQGVYSYLKELELGA